VEDDGKGWVWLAAEMSPGGSFELADQGLTPEE